MHIRALVPSCNCPIDFSRDEKSGSCDEAREKTSEKGKEKNLKRMAIGNETEKMKRGRVFLISRGLSSHDIGPRKNHAFFSLVATRGQVSFNYRKSNERPPHRVGRGGPELRKHDYCWNRAEYWRGETGEGRETRGTERCLANMRSWNIDRSDYVPRSRDILAR